MFVCYTQSHVTFWRRGQDRIFVTDTVWVYCVYRLSVTVGSGS